MASEALSEPQGNVDTGKMGDKINGGGVERRKLHGRAFYESIGSPKIVLAPMVEQSEFVRLPHTLTSLTTHNSSLY